MSSSQTESIAAICFVEAVGVRLALGARSYAALPLGWKRWRVAEPAT
jgi:hypothetical protein